MSSPSEKQLNTHLRRAVSAILSNHAEELWNTPVNRADSNAWFLEGTEPKRKSTQSFIRWASLAAACFAILIFGWFYVYRVTDATIYLDVNPSVTVAVNRFGKVVKAEADNEDGRIILDNMDLRGNDIDVVMNALLGSMVKHGYFSQAQSILLISVNGRNEARTTALRQKISVNAQQTLESLLGSGVVLGQNVDLNDATEEIAEHYGITPGKAALITRILKYQPEWSVQELAAMSMTDLIRYCQASGIDITQYLGEDGEVIGDFITFLDDDDDHDDYDEEDDFDDQDDRDDVDDKDDDDDHDGDDSDDHNGIDDEDKDDADDKDDDDDHDGDDSNDQDDIDDEDMDDENDEDD